MTERVLFVKLWKEQDDMEIKQLIIGFASTGLMLQLAFADNQSPLIIADAMPGSNQMVQDNSNAGMPMTMPGSNQPPGGAIEQQPSSQAEGVPPVSQQPFTAPGSMPYGGAQQQMAPQPPYQQQGGYPATQQPFPNPMPPQQGQNQNQPMSPTIGQQPGGMPPMMGPQQPIPSQPQNSSANPFIYNTSPPPVNSNSNAVTGPQTQMPVPPTSGAPHYNNSTNAAMVSPNTPIATPSQQQFGTPMIISAQIEN